MGIGWLSAWERRHLPRPEVVTNPDDLGAAVTKFSLTTVTDRDDVPSRESSSDPWSFPVDSIGVIVPSHYLRPPCGVDELLPGDVAFCVPWYLELDQRGRCFFGGGPLGSRAIWHVDVPFPADSQVPRSPWRPADVGIAMTASGLAVGVFTSATNRWQVGVMERATEKNPSRIPATPIALVYVNGVLQPQLENVGVVPRALRYPILFSAPGGCVFADAPQVR